MRAFLTNCIICGKELPPFNQRGKDGEHIIPAAFYGLFKIKDVCTECNSYFGSNVDMLLLKDKRIINAIFKLKIENLERIVLTNSRIHGIDPNDGKRIEMEYRGGEITVLPQNMNDSIMIMDENMSKRYWEGKLAKDISKGLRSEEDLNEFKDEEWKRYIESDCNTIFRSKIPGIVMQKRELSDIKVEYDISNDDAKKTIAKIAVEFLWATLPKEIMIKVFNQWKTLVDICRYNADIPEYMFLYDNINQDVSYNHQVIIRFDVSPKLIFFDVVLFGTVDYRVLLKSDEPINGIVLPDNRKIDRIGFGMSFNPKEKRKKTIGIHDATKNEWFNYDFTNLI